MRYQGLKTLTGSLLLISVCLILFSIYRYKDLIIHSQAFARREAFSAVVGRILTSQTKRPVKILLWNLQGNVSHPKSINDGTAFCEFTRNREDVRESSAIVIHYRNTSELPPPQTRNPNQIYVWMCRESPAITREVHDVILDEKFDYYFNATMTYRRNSEIFHPYAEILHRKRPQSESEFVNFFLQYDEILAQKRHLAIGVVSNCKTNKGAVRRMLYLKQLAKDGLKVDLFGRCFNSSFPSFRSIEASQLISRYKFYLAFENSRHCRDYVTEKFWDNAIYSGAVPIVRGAPDEDLRVLAPNHSYINADNFKTTKELVKFLNFLDKNDNYYMKYFEWRKRLMSEKNVLSRDSSLSLSLLRRKSVFGFHKLCRALCEKNFKNFSTISSLNTWWYEKENSNC